MAQTDISEKLARFWIGQVTSSDKAQQKFLTRAKQIKRKYKAEATGRGRKLQLLWANVQVVLPATYSAPPAPVVTRRFKDADPVGRAASEVLERALAYSVDKQNLDGTLKACNLDFTLVSRAVAWERYVPTHGDEVVPEVPVTQVTTDAGIEFRDAEGKAYEPDLVSGGPEDFKAKGEAYRPVVYEESQTDFVALEDFGHSPGRTWGEVWFVWRRVFMDRGQLVGRFGEKIGRAVKLDWGPSDQLERPEAEQPDCKAAVYEIWDKRSKRAIWISLCHKAEPLDVRDDPLGLDDFFPCPRPLYGTLDNESLLPTPDYLYWQDQAEEINTLTQRIGELEEAIKVRGFYAGSDKTNLDALLSSRNATMIPIAEWQPLKEGGGIRGMIEWWPIEQVVAALKACIELRNQLIEDVYQITGISDILRGETDPRETAKAQGIKAQWGSLRVRDRQKEMARFARDLIRLKGEVIAEQFSVETLKAMTGVDLPTAEEKAQIEFAMKQAQILATQTGQAPQVPPEFAERLAKPSWEDVKALLEDNASRQFRIDIETDSTIEPDESEEKARATEFLTALGGFVTNWGPVVQAKPELAPMAAALMKWGARRFRAGRDVEDVIETAMDKLGAAPPPTPAPEAAPQRKSPEELAIEMENAKTKRIGVVGDLQARQVDQQLAFGDQQLKGIAMQRDPQPQAAA